MSYHVFSLDQYGYQNHGSHEKYTDAINHRNNVSKRIKNRLWVTQDNEFVRATCPNCGREQNICDGFDCVDEKHLRPELRP